jgi:hypothetical protein
MQNKEAETVASIIIGEIIARFGVPQAIHSDQGKQYECRLIQEMCKVLHIIKTRTTLIILSQMEWDFGNDAKCLCSGKS